MVKNLPAVWEIWVQSLGWEDSLEEGMATHSSILAWRLPWTEEPGKLQSTGSQRVGYDCMTKHSTAAASYQEPPSRPGSGSSSDGKPNNANIRALWLVTSLSV